MISYGRQKITTADLKSVQSALESPWLTQGPTIAQFEEVFSNYCNAPHATAVCNGTAALHLILLSLGLGPGDSVIVPAMTFLSDANCVEFVGSRPIFVDIDPSTYLLDLNHVEKILQTDASVKAIVAVDFAGLPVPMQSLANLAKFYNVRLIEDACHALGSDYKDRTGWKKTGASSCADATFFSFHPVKHITTGEGGMILTQDLSLSQKTKQLRSHGTKSGSIPNRPWQYLMEELGYNYRITDLQCALGVSQLKNIDAWVQQRRMIAHQYDHFFKDCSPIKRPPIETDLAKSSFHLYVIQTDRRDELYHHLKARQIDTQVHYMPVPLQPYYQKKYGYKNGDFPITEKYAERCLSLPCYVDLSENDCQRVAELVIAFVDS